MLIYVARRLALALVTCAAISVLTFIIIRLPPGDFVDAYIANLAVGGSSVSAEQAEAMRREYGPGIGGEIEAVVGLDDAIHRFDLPGIGRRRRDVAGAVAELEHAARNALTVGRELQSVLRAALVGNVELQALALPDLDIDRAVLRQHGRRDQQGSDETSSELAAR